MKKLLAILAFSLPALAMGQIPYQIANGEYENFIIDKNTHILYALGTPLGIGSATQNISYATAAQFQNSSGTTISAPSIAFVAAGLHTGACADMSGNVYVTGNNEDGTWGNGSTTGGTNYFRKIDTDSLGNPFTNVVSLWMASSIFTGGAGYGAIIYAIKSDGTLWVWGNTQGGYRGDGTYGQVNTRPVQVPFPGGTVITKVRAQIVAIALDNAGNVWTWAGNGPNDCLLGSTSRTNYLQPVKLTLPATAKDIAGGGFFSYALLTTGSLYGWGLWTGYMGVGSAATNGYNPLNAPILLDTALNLPSPINKLSTNYYTTYVILNDGSLWSWGANECGQAGIGSEIDWKNYGFPFPYGTTTPHHFAWDQDASTTQYQSHKPKNMAPGINDFIDMSEGYDYVFYKHFIRLGGRLYGLGRNKGSVLADGVSEGTPTDGSLGNIYPNSWDRTRLTEIFPFSGGTTTFSTSPECITNPGATGCSVFSPGSNIKPTANVVVASSGTTIYLNGSGSTDDHHISYWEFSSPTLQNMGIVTGQKDTIYGVAPGVYTVKLKVTDNGWLSDSMSVTFTVGASNCHCSYYFAAAGSDANPGTNSQPFQSLAKLQSLATDTTASFYLNRGDSFFGSIINFAGKTLDCFGTGTKPIISGFTTLSGWSSLGGGIYSSSCPGCKFSDNMLTMDGVQQPLARWPNTGYRTYTSFTGTTSITDPTLTNTPNWTGAYLVMKNNQYTLSTDTITNHSTTTITYNSATGLPGTNNFGYFISNHAAALDTLGEWIVVSGSGIVKMFFGASTPSSHVVKTTISDTLLSLADGLKAVSINNIDFEGAGIYGIYIGQDTNTIIQNCTFNYAGSTAILDNKGQYSRLINNKTRNCNDNGIFTAGMADHTYMAYDSVAQCGMMPGQGRLWQTNNYKGIATTSHRAIVEYCRVDTTGYNNISGYNYDKINHNWANAACNIIQDGAAIYSLGYTDTTEIKHIDSNVVVHGIGAPGGTNAATRFVNGIYIDQNNANIFIKGNTVWDMPNGGIFIHNARRVNILDNVVYSCTYQILFQGDTWVYPINNMTVKRNRLGVSGTNQYMYRFDQFNGLHFNNSYGSIDSNYYGYYSVTTAGFMNSIVNQTYKQWQDSVSDTHGIVLAAPLLFQANGNNSPVAVSLSDSYVDALNIPFYTTATIPAFAGLLLFRGNYFRIKKNHKTLFQ